jgi:K+/H+ antiporter YhaU regulatory subunit KhtT
MLAILSVIAIVLISMLINRFATIALSLTGMSREEARFQARAAMSGVGLTTSRPEEIVGHPVRRRIVLWLMIVGSAGVVTAIASLVLSFRGGDSGARLSRAGVLVGALLLTWLTLRTPAVDRALSRAIAWLLRKRGLADRDRGTLLALRGEHAIVELQVREGDWVAGRSLAQLGLRAEGVVVLGVEQPDGRYVGIPHADTVVRPRDTLIVYGRRSRVAELDGRRAGHAGDIAHERACAQQRTLQADDDAAEEHAQLARRASAPGS